MLLLTSLRVLGDLLAERLHCDGAIEVVGRVDRATSLRHQVTALRPDVVLALAEDLEDLVASLRNAWQSEPTPRTRLVVFGLRSGDLIRAPELIQAGVTGLLREATPLEKLCEAIAAVSEGHSVLPRDAIDLILARASRRGRSTGLLTRREWEVAELVERGLSNKEIARALGISVSTTKAHVHGALARLELSGRARLAHWFRSHAGAGPLI